LRGAGLDRRLFVRRWPASCPAAVRKESAVISLHHAHLMASDVDATIAFWREHFGAEVVFDGDFAGARNVFLQVGQGRLHLYAQPPRQPGPATVHHLGVETDELESLVGRLKSAGVSVTDVRRLPQASYAMAQGPDGLLLELFQPDLASVDATLSGRGYFATVKGG
jgi:catechol 2,3-dioxygenase-like lactoylglutathione lyase family enzyme